MRTLTALLGWAGARRRVIVAVFGFTVLLFVVVAPAAGAGDLYSNIGPAPQLSAGSLAGRYPLANYQLDQYFPGISVGLLSGVDVSGVPPLIAYFIAQVIWLITAFLANALITLFAFAFNLDLLGGNGTPSSGALTPIADAIHNLYTGTFGAPWLVAAIVLAGLWAMWKALVQRRYTETAGALALSLLYCVIAVGIVTQPQRTIAPASKLSNQLSTSLLSLTSHGSIEGEQQAKTGAANQLFSLLVLDPWTVLEFGGIEQCASTQGEKTRSVAVRPLSASPAQDSQLAAQLEAQTEVRAPGKTCVNARNKYAPHFLAYPYQSQGRNSEHEALEHGSDEDLPDSDPAKHDPGGYPLGPVDEPAAEAMGKGGQYQRLLLAVLILVGEFGAFLVLGSLSLGVILAQILLLTLLAFAPVALVIAVFPGRGHDVFRAWLGKLASYLARKVIYSLILAVLLAVCQALTDATSNLGWLLAFALQAAFLWAVFLQRNRLTGDLLAATAGPQAAREGANRLQALYYTSRLARLTDVHRHPPPTAPRGDSARAGEVHPPAPAEAPVTAPPPRGADVREPGDDLEEPIASSEAPSLVPSDPSAPAPAHDSQGAVAGSELAPHTVANDPRPDPDEEPT
jgi:hypothetical protein